MKDKRIRKKKRIAFCKGLLSMCVFLAFTILLVSSTIDLNNVHETLLMRQSVTQQFFKGEKSLPIYFREFVDVYEYILDYEGHLFDKENIFFRDNTLLPYMQAQVYRVSKGDCEEFLDRPGLGEIFSGQKCKASFSKGNYQTDEWNGWAYSEKKGWAGGYLNTKFD